MTAWWTHAKFWLLAAVAIAFSILILVVRGLLQKKGKTENEGFGGLPPAPAVIQQAADQAYENSITVKATTKATTEEQKKRLADISKMEDRKARRKALADFVSS